MPVTATYRLQLHAGFGFRQAEALVAYLYDLGVSHGYASPYLAAEPGSTHGYNLVDPGRLNPEIGDERALRAWTDRLASRGMGHVVDMVPNHMAASVHNAWWADVLENGPSSLYAEHFDIEWHPPKAALEDKVLLPVLGDQYGHVLERGELRLERHAGALGVRYFERVLPLDPSSLVPLLEGAAAALDLPADDPRKQELESIVTGLRNLPATTDRAPDRRAERAREKEVLKRRLAAACEDEATRAAVDAAVAAANGTPGDPRSFDALDALLLQQPYRLAYWRVATEEINYRRFFDINDLAAVRMEEPAVFQDALRLLLQYVAEGRLQGIRLDHTDGLFDPAAFFRDLRRAIDELTGRSGRGQDVYLVAEKILGPGEELPASWAIDGTTGYDFLVQASGVLVDARAEQALTRLYEEIAGDARTFADHVLEAKRAIMRSSLASEVTMLAQRLERIAMRDRRSRDFTFPMLRRAVAETIAAFPVYRTYVRPDGTRERTDEAIVTRAIRLARRRNPEVSPSAFELLRGVLLLSREPLDEEDGAARSQFAMRFQQLTGPVAAKGVEDTAFYTYLRFVALNEVGGDPARFGTSVAELHAANAARRERWPRTLLATSTHDTKRGEDVRARLAVLSEIPDQWGAWVRAWLGQLERHRRLVDDEPAPSAADLYLFLQTALGAWPLEPVTPAVLDALTERLVEYAVKAAREAKQRTSWLSPDDEYESALQALVRGAMGDEVFVASVADRARALAPYGASNGLALVALKIASPGVCDTYQGSEAWDLRLVDPDNRRPVDHAALRRLAARLEGARVSDLRATFEDGALKLHVLRQGLRLRRREAALFVEGSYEPLDAPDEIVAFTRRHAGASLVCAVTRQPYRVTRGRLPWAVGDVWGARRVEVPAGSWLDVLSGRRHEVAGGGLAAATLFEDLPVALLFAPAATTR